jgi:hypothetical protein
LPSRQIGRRRIHCAISRRQPNRDKLSAQPAVADTMSDDEPHAVRDLGWHLVRGGRRNDGVGVGYATGEMRFGLPPAIANSTKSETARGFVIGRLLMLLFISGLGL